MWHLLDQAPDKFDASFLEWLQKVEDSVAISFADWHPSAAETQELERFLHRTGQEVPSDLRIYYKHVYPFDNVKNGGSLWVARLEQYTRRWIEQQQHEGVTAKQKNDSVSALSVLWPVDCFRHYDTVAFQTRKGDLAVVHINTVTAQAIPVAVGLRNYFLTQVALQILADTLDTEPDWERHRFHPTIASLSQWPVANPPHHICLEAGVVR